MAFADTIDVLNDLLVTHYRSLLIYLHDASPWMHRGDEKAAEVVADIADDQQSTSRQLADLIVQRGGVLEMGDYPTVYTDTHFLSLDFMLKELVVAQTQDIQTIELCVARLWNDPPAEAVAKEALGAARAHLQSLEELTAEVSSA